MRSQVSLGCSRPNQALHLTRSVTTNGTKRTNKPRKPRLVQCGWSVGGIAPASKPWAIKARRTEERPIPSCRAIWV